MLLVFVALSAGMFVKKITTPRILSDQELKLNGAYVFDKPRIIKPFELVDQDGQPFRLEQLEGKWTLMFFGFTFCPDICPTTLADMKKLKNMLAEAGHLDDVQFVLVTVDPARDTPEKLKDYVSYFDPSFIGVGGDFMELVKLTANLNVAFNKVMLSEEGDYTVDHTANIVLINPKSHYHGFFKPQATLSQGQFDPGKLKVTLLSIQSMLPES